MEGPSKQEVIALSTTEAKYVAITHATKEALWLRTLIKELFGEIKGPTTLYSNNQSAIALTKDHQHHMCTKHIDIWFHFVRWIIEEGKVRLIYCPTADMLADLLTKALLTAKVKHFAAALELSHDWGGMLKWVQSHIVSFTFILSCYLVTSWPHTSFGHLWFPQLEPPNSGSTWPEGTIGRL